MLLVDYAPEAPDDALTKELRLALVCYGGVSLAIYMHGITKELQKLVIASDAYERDPVTNPFDAQTTEHAYWNALEAVARSGPRTRVVVDIVAGSSAGGINGICLAKALAHDLTQDELRRVWFGKGGIARILAERFLQAVVPGRRDFFYRWIYDTLQKMTPRTAAQDGSLLPDDRPLELYVTVTDFYGFNQNLPIDDPRTITERRHRHVLEFRSDKGQFDHDHDGELAFAARTSASFPVVFKPTSVTMIGKQVNPWPGEATFTETFFNIYPLSGGQLEQTYFVDGGVLDNYPFGPAIEAMTRKAAATQVERRLLYIEPDPAGRAFAPGWRPSLLKTAIGALSTLPRREPILDDVQNVRRFNERVRRVNSVIRGVSPTVEQDVHAELVRDPGRSYEQLNGALTAKAEQTAGAHQLYVGLKLYSVVERLAVISSELSKYPRASNHTYFVRDALLAWAQQRGRFDVPPAPAQIAFLKRFDLGYVDRRLRFTIKALNDLYRALRDPDRDPQRRPNRDDLNEAKAALYARLDVLSNVVEGARTQEELVVGVRNVFGPEHVNEALRLGTDPAAFAGDRRAALDELETRLERYLHERLEGFGEATYRAVEAAIEGWEDDAQRLVRGRFLGFPLWDMILFPIQRLSEVGELSEVKIVRLSPEETRLLGHQTAEQKLKGTKFGHFGAFFRRKWREQDYVWGRLDGVEHLLAVLLQKPRGHDDLKPFAAPAFKAVLAEEKGNLRFFRSRYRKLRRSVDGLAQAAGP